MLPTSIDRIMEKTGLTKVPVNAHVNELEKYLLVKRDRGTGQIRCGENTECFFAGFNVIKKFVTENFDQLALQIVK
ncbi:MAG: hypothetical protein KAI57_04625 [Candidatus Pacebacteria bacterium]|nr:hypothetical protein [Candidatus Paceibacterota bacterium]